MRLLRRPFVRAQIEVASGNKAVMAQDILDVANRAAVEEECCRHRVAQHVRGDRLGKADHFSKTAEPGERRAKSHGLTPPAHHKERLSVIMAPRHILFDPVERTRTEKQHAFLVAFADDRRLPCLEIDRAALERQRFRYSRAGTEEHFDKYAERKP